ncbi:MAG: rna polymerase iii subunit c11 [Lasallia pustulata]|uniref:Rna polymerase iii subunit c11 n=1 Tax=Lasallia pustulata TaxID=136370 RepID=A0A5M8PND9_9LECA|nr:MAG: rna polymerase iii subunit c11 [Lasallia pustulata]
MLLFCPCCSNSLTVSRNPPTDAFPLGQNRLECRTCPYQFLINQRYYERKEMKRKEVEDVMGGKDAWANVDKTDAQCADKERGRADDYVFEVYNVWPAMEGELSDTFTGKERLEDTFSAGVGAGDGGRTNGDDCGASSQPPLYLPDFSPFHSILSSYTTLRVYPYRQITRRRTQLKPSRFVRAWKPRMV